MRRTPFIPVMAAFAAGLFSGCAVFKPLPPTVIVVREAAGGMPSCPELGIAHLRVLRVPPFSQVEVNGRIVGETPLDGFLPLPAGLSRISILHAHFPPLDTLVELSAGEYRAIRFNNPSALPAVETRDSL